jgi:hypothetical protein
MEEPTNVESLHNAFESGADDLKRFYDNSIATANQNIAREQEMIDSLRGNEQNENAIKACQFNLAQWVASVRFCEEQLALIRQFHPELFQVQSNPWHALLRLSESLETLTSLPCRTRSTTCATRSARAS